MKPFMNRLYFSLSDGIDFDSFIEFGNNYGDEVNVIYYPDKDYRYHLVIVNFNVRAGLDIESFKKILDKCKVKYHTNFNWITCDDLSNKVLYSYSGCWITFKIYIFKDISESRTCWFCEKKLSGNRKKFCCNEHKDRWHNIHNPRGYCADQNDLSDDSDHPYSSYSLGQD